MQAYQRVRICVRKGASASVCQHISMLGRLRLGTFPVAALLESNLMFQLTVVILYSNSTLFLLDLTPGGFLCRRCSPVNRWISLPRADPYFGKIPPTVSRARLWDRLPAPPASSSARRCG